MTPWPYHYDGQFYVKNGRVLVYTDGCCYSNGREDACGGYGVYFGPNNRNNISHPLWGDKQTNNRAEILAVYFALKTIYKAGYRAAEVRTDSSYAIDCITDFMPNKWKMNDWITSQGHEAKNRRELELVDYYDTRMDVFYTFVERDSDAWNTAADELAKDGADQNCDDSGSDDEDDGYPCDSCGEYHYNQEECRFYWSPYGW